MTDLSPLARLPALEELAIAACTGLTSIAPLAALPRLAQLDVSGCDNIADLSVLAGAQQLRVLELDSRHAAPFLRHLPALQSIHIHQCDDHALGHLDGSQSLARLKIGDESPLETLRLHDVPNLQRIEIEELGMWRVAEVDLIAPSLASLWLSSAALAQLTLRSGRGAPLKRVQLPRGQSRVQAPAFPALGDIYVPCAVELRIEGGAQLR